MIRKSSNPLMAPFMVSAPGKVIVFGEHAVVYGKNAMAASLSLRSYLLVTALSRSKRTVTLRFPDIGLDHTWPIDDLPWQEFSKPGKKKHYYDHVSSLDEDLVEAMKPHIMKVDPETPTQAQKTNRAAASSFLYLFLSLGSQAFPGCIYTLRSTLPIGSGLGSSASISVCISAALLLQIHALAGPHPDQPIEEARLQVQRINQWAFLGEVCIHDKPSGVDNTVSSGGKAVMFQRIDYQKAPVVTPLWNFPKLALILTSTKQPRTTATQVGKVGKLKQDHPEIVDHILEAIDKVAKTAQNTMSSPAFENAEAGHIHQVGELMDVNHGLLASLGVSHPKLERVRELVESLGAGWTKLTGAGGGGCTITLLNPGASPGTVKQLESDLDAEGFERYETFLGGDGVGVLWPSISRHGERDQGIEDIDEEMFLNTKGREALEKLVGIDSGKSWKFWR